MFPEESLDTMDLRCPLPRHRLMLLIAGITAAVLAACAGLSGEAGLGAPLEGTYWKLVEAGGKAPKSAADRFDAHIRFEAETKRVSGYSAVNNFSGTYEASGSKLRFGPVAATRRAGPPDAMEVESKLFIAFDATRSYRISGQSLELLDAGGKPLARFESRPAS